MQLEDKKLKDEILNFISTRVKCILARVDPVKLMESEEIRLRSNRPLMLQGSHGDWFVDLNGNLTRRPNNPFITTPEDVIKTLELMSENSIYAYLDEIRNGFITLKGGHRIGIAGKVVAEGDSIKNIKDISGLNIRIAREVRGCSLKVIRHVLSDKNCVYNTLIVSPPQCGKTTILRDMTRIISDGMAELDFQGIKVGIIDERSEIAACYKGIPQNQVGMRTDVLDGCPKAAGMSMMLRSMSPQVIVTDEIGNQGDKDAVMKVINAGVKIITTAHGYNISELKSRLEVLSLIEQKVFERYIVLSSFNGPGTIEEVIDGSNMKVIYRRE
ncbi:MAG: stage III sporulation protein AA [Clostridia bacterium]|nr:stage III sporulation protein AA [Clostridia bacterium]